jgi:hypothetical protein
VNILNGLFGINRAEASKKISAPKDWRQSPAHRLLLTKFISPVQIEYITGLDYWKEVLGQETMAAIQMFVGEGLLIEPALAEIVEISNSQVALKGKLKERKLKVSGRKSELAARLAEVDPEGMKLDIGDRHYLSCSPMGSKIAFQFESEIKAEKENAEKITMEFIKSGKFYEACEGMARYEAQQVFQRGLNCNWKNYNPSNDSETLKIISESTPKILSKLDDNSLASFRIAASMMYIWGASKADRWLPEDLQPNFSLDNSTIARMFVFFARNKFEIKRYRSVKSVKKMQIIAAPDSCEYCLKFSKRQFEFDAVPEIPHEHCTHEMGCRCLVLPAVD